jgi:hypothetical protein
MKNDLIRLIETLDDYEIAYLYEFVKLSFRG